MLLFRLIFSLAFSPIKIVLLVARTLGYNRFFVFLLGVGVGLLVAPTTGAELRRRIQEEVELRMNPPAPPVPPVPPVDPAGVIGREINTPEV